MGLGVGIGSFVSGISKGMDLRDRIDDGREKQANKDALAGIETAGKSDFDKSVGEGAATPDQWEGFWTSYVLPKKRMELLRQGNLDGAAALQSWGDSADAKAGGKLFSSALLRAQTGDPGGALDDAIKAGKLKGYIDSGYEFGGQDTIQDQQGNVVGYRLTIKGPDGKDMQQDVSIGDVPNLIARFLNPDAAFQSQLDAKAASSKAEGELSTYERKKVIDQKYEKPSGSSDKLRSDAISSIRKRMDGGLAGDEPSFDDLDRDQQEQLITKELELQTGAAATPAPLGTGAPADKVVVDQNTGTVIGTGGPTPGGPSAGVAAPPAGPTTQATPVTAAQPAAGQQVPALSNDQARVLQYVAEQAGQGGDIQALIKLLTERGVPQQLWPPALSQAVPAAPGRDPGLAVPIGLGQ